MLAVKCFTRLKHTALDRLRVCLNIILLWYNFWEIGVTKGGSSWYNLGGFHAIYTLLRPHNATFLDTNPRPGDIQTALKSAAKLYSQSQQSQTVRPVLKSLFIASVDRPNPRNQLKSLDATEGHKSRWKWRRSWFQQAHNVVLDLRRRHRSAAGTYWQVPLFLNARTDHRCCLSRKQIS